MAGAQDSYPVALQWNEESGSLKKLKHKLLLYFQKRSESNGGECEIRDTDTTRGYILIYFKEERARDGVLQKDRHELKLSGGKKMRLDVRRAEEGESQRSEESSADSRETFSPQSPAASVSTDRPQHVVQAPPSSLVLIENLQDSYTTEMINLLVENLSEKSEDTDFHVERIPEIQSAVITFTCDIDTLKIVEKFSTSSRVKQAKMTARLLEETRTIRVEGLPPNTFEDYLSLYFENPRHGSCGSTEDISVIPDEGAALVTFTTVEAAKKVLARNHEFGRAEVAVYPYYASLDMVLYGKQRPHIPKPEPLTFPVSPYILEFILSNAQFKDNMEESMEAHTCQIKWPDLLVPNPVITLCFPHTLSTHLRKMVKIVPTWKGKVHREFSRLISKYKVVEYHMNQSVWDTVRGDVSSSTYHGVLLKPNLSTDKVFLTGLVKDVTRMEPEFRKLVEETTKKVERKIQSKVETLSMSPALYQMMCHSGLKKRILDQAPELKMDYDVPRKEIQLSGLKEELLTAKYEIMNINQQMKSKQVQINPPLLQFLNCTDNEELSCLLFGRHNINAMLEIDEDGVKLSAYSKKDLTEAEELMNRELVCRKFFVEEKSILKSLEWKSLLSYLLESYNAQRSSVLILEPLTGAENNVLIAGLSSSVQKSSQEVGDFLEKNTPIEKTMKVKSLVVMQFLKEEKKQVLDELAKANLTWAIHNTNIRLKGPRLYVTKAHSSLAEVLSSLYSDTLCIDQPGAKKLYLLNEEIYVTTAKSTYGCLLRLQKEGEQEMAEDEMEGPLCQVNLPNSVLLSVHKDDLCRLNVDVIVNAANEGLQHVGGLALALLKAAGPKLQEDSDMIIKKEGNLSAGESVITDSGRLPCKQVIHTVGPRWSITQSTQCERLLRKAITSSLELAEEYCHASIAFPAVGSGIFGCPVDKTAENILKAIIEFMDKKPKGSSSIKEIHLVDTNENTVRMFASALRKEFGMEEAEPAPKSRVRGAERVVSMEAPQEVHQTNMSANRMMTKENIIIKLTEGFIQDAATPVVVNSVGKDLDLSSGGASKALLNRAGSKLQQCLSDVSAGVQVKEGAVLITDGCNLPCKTVIHVVVPQWDGGQGSSEKIFREVVSRCLGESEKKKMASVTFPAIGTGALGFPKRSVASFMIEEILNFSSQSNPKHVREVSVILHPNDKETLKEFSKELSSRMGRNAPVRTPMDINAPGKSQSSPVHVRSGPGAAGFFGMVSTPVAGTHEMTIGSVTYEVKLGDITKEDTDFIVNSTDRTFTTKSGVSKAILEAAGQDVVYECSRLASQGNKEHIITQNGNLRCKKILHKTGTNSAKGIKAFVIDALTECARHQATSVAFPAIGTGMGHVSPPEVADCILEAVASFAQSPQSIQKVKVVIFQKQILNDFLCSMKKKEGTPLPNQEGLLSKVTNSLRRMFRWKPEDANDSKVFEVRENIEPAIFQLCAESRGAVDKTKAWLRDLIMKEQNENTITDDWIQEFNSKEQEELFQLQKMHQVSLVIDLPNFTLQVLGLSKDVLLVSNKIQEMIKIVRNKKTREREAELCSNLVEWGYVSRGKFLAFDKMTNMELEKAKDEDRQSISIEINGSPYTVIVELLSARDPKGNGIQLQRNPKHRQLGVPGHWTPMDKDNMKVVQLAVGDPEYTDVETQFRKSCQMRIIKIERIQNRHLWLNYQIKKQSIDDKNGSTNNEKRLFHGLDPNAVNSVNYYGFNRSYAGKNAAFYGNGTYFAVNANYSALDTYSRPDANGIKYMYLSLVVTGMVCAGKQGMIAPPSKNPSNCTDQYDSASDNPANPVMYVIFHDIQAYPQYLITFTK